MTKDVAIEELREKLDEVMEDVEHGVTINVIRAGRSVATLVPLAIARPVTKRLADFVPGPRPKRLDFDAVEWLLEDRQHERH
jgi:antitoxin (DNA-binding transcriptional repressor) of toxin-antitoxin stability system